MNVYELIIKKRNGGELSSEEIQFIVEGYVKGEIPDYQMAAFLMAVFFVGMTKREMVDYTWALARSGEILDLSSIDGPKIDKHSTGGVGDKVSLVLAPLVAACGIKVPMISGRGLGHTGGTLDKLESIPGLRTDLSVEEFIRQVSEIGVAIVAQTPQLAPADGKIYALRDVTATVDSIPLIAGSIMSKKLAEGIDGLVLDVKTGNGAFMRQLEEARALAKAMVSIGTGAGKKMHAFITDMNQPLGDFVGNSLEVYEAVQILKGKEGRLTDLIISLAARMLVMGGITQKIDDAKTILEEKIKSGEAFDKFLQMVAAQGGDTVYVTDKIDYLLSAPKKVPFKADKSGVIVEIDTYGVGMAGVLLGAGRRSKDDKIDPLAGFEIKKHIGDEVKSGEEILLIYGSDDNKIGEALNKVRSCFVIGDREPATPPLIYEEVYG